MRRKLANKVAIVTGASGGLGGEISAALAQERAVVCLAEIDLEAAETAAARIDGQAFAAKLDIRSPEVVSDVLHPVIDNAGVPDIHLRRIK